MTVYDPPDAGVKLDAVEKALAAIVSSPHLTKTQLAQAKKVSEDVEKTVAELETPAGKKLSKEARAAKVSASINELQGLQAEWSKAATQMVATQKAKLLGELKAKEAELAKDTKMLKVITLEKALAEKKLSLQKLIEQKREQGAQKEAQKEAAVRQDMVAKALDVAKAMQTQKKPADDKLKPVMTYLKDRMQKVSADLAKMDAANKKEEAELGVTINRKMPAMDKSDPLVKAQGIIKMLLKKQHRQFEKARLPLQNELKELNQAVTAIDKGDAAGLKKVMSRMQGEMKSVQAKSHKFLY